MLKYTYKKISNSDTSYISSLLDNLEKNLDLLNWLSDLRKSVVQLKILDNYIQNIPISEYLITSIKSAINPDIISKISNYKYLKYIKTCDISSELKYPALYNFHNFNLELFDFYLNKISELIKINNPEKIFEFACLKNTRYFTGFIGVTYEQKMELNTRRPDNCSRYLVNLYQEDILVINMFVFLFEKFQEQSHFFIVKNMYYILTCFANNKPEIRNSSILLHSFAAFIFNSESIYTVPIENMIKILDLNKIPFIKKYDPELLNKLKINYPGCFTTKLESDEIYFIKTEDIKYKWLANNLFENIKKLAVPEYIFIIPNNQLGGNKYKYKKYKAKYLELKYIG